MGVDVYHVMHCVISRSRHARVISLSVCLTPRDISWLSHTAWYLAAITHCWVISLAVTHRAMSRCVHHTLPGYLAVRHTPRDVAMCPSHTARYHAVCPSHTAGLSRCPSHTARYRDVSVTHRVTHCILLMWCMHLLYFLQHSSSASPSLSYNLINKPASYYSKQGVSCTVGNGTGS